MAQGAKGFGVRLEVSESSFGTRIIFYRHPALKRGL